MMQVIINGIDGAMGTILAGVIEKTDDMEVVGRWMHIRDQPTWS